jgi:hypothetical protein
MFGEFLHYGKKPLLCSVNFCVQDKKKYKICMSKTKKHIMVSCEKKSGLRGKNSTLPPFSNQINGFPNEQMEYSSIKTLLLW